MRSALLKDEAYIADILQGVIADETMKQSVLELVGDEAEAFLTLMHKVRQSAIIGEWGILRLIVALFFR